MGSVKASEQQELWRQRVAEQQKSGLSIQAFCKQNGIPAHALYAWRKKVSAQKPVTFALVKTKPLVAETRMLEFVWSQGERLQIPCEESVLRMVLSVLREQS
jgi:transposase-like protein